MNHLKLRQMSMPSCSCGTIESGPHRTLISLPPAIALENTIATWVTNTTIITAAQIRWMRPAPSKPPRMRASVGAHGCSEYSSGRPESAQPTKVSIRHACSTRSIGVKRR